MYLKLFGYIYFLFGVACTLLTSYTIFCVIGVVHIKFTSTKIENGRALDMLEEIVSDADITEPIELYSYVPFLNSGYFSEGDYINRDYYGSVFINMQKSTLETLSDQALRGLIAHEVGHYALGHIDMDKSGMTYEDILYHQAEADRFALENAGEDALKACFDELHIERSIPDAR